MASTAARIIAGVCGASMLVFGGWALLAPASFAALVDFPPYNAHLLHDLGAFQIGIGVTTWLAIFWDDALAVGLAGFVVAGGLHTANHAADLELGGHLADGWLLGSLVVLAAVGLILQVGRGAGRRPSEAPPLR